MQAVLLLWSCSRGWCEWNKASAGLGEACRSAQPGAAVTAAAARRPRLPDSCIHAWSALWLLIYTPTLMLHSPNGVLLQPGWSIRENGSGAGARPRGSPPRPTSPCTHMHCHQRGCAAGCWRPACMLRLLGELWGGCSRASHHCAMWWEAPPPARGAAARWWWNHALPRQLRTPGGSQSHPHPIKTVLLGSRGDGCEDCHRCGPHRGRRQQAAGSGGGRVPPAGRLLAACRALHSIGL